MMRYLPLIALIVCAPSVHAQMFKCQDAGGQTSYQQTPCSEGAKSVSVSLDGRPTVHSKLPCDEFNIELADKKLAAFLKIVASEAVWSVRHGSTAYQEAARFRLASSEATSVQVPRCMEAGKEVVQRYLSYSADRLALLTRSPDALSRPDSTDFRTDDFRAEYQAALSAARQQAAEPSNVWSKKEH